MYRSALPASRLANLRISKTMTKPWTTLAWLWILQYKRTPPFSTCRMHWLQIHATNLLLIATLAKRNQPRPHTFVISCVFFPIKKNLTANLHTPSRDCADDKWSVSHHPIRSIIRPDDMSDGVFWQRARLRRLICIPIRHQRSPENRDSVRSETSLSSVDHGWCTS